MSIYKSISSQEAEDLLAKDKDVIVIDIRTPQEMKSGVLGNPINIDFYSPDFSEKINQLDKEKTYLIYCRSGNRSKVAMEIMKSLGFKSIYELAEGILG